MTAEGRWLTIEETDERLPAPPAGGATWEAVLDWLDELDEVCGIDQVSSDREDLLVFWRREGADWHDVAGYQRPFVQQHAFAPALAPLAKVAPLLGSGTFGPTPFTTRTGRRWVLHSSSDVSTGRVLQAYERLP